MVANPNSRSLGRSVKRNLLWQYLKLQGRREGFNTGDLDRVRLFLDNKFGAHPIEYERPDQTPSAYFPGLTAMPVHDPYKFEWVRNLEAHAGEIVAEFLRLRDTAKLQPHPQDLADSGAWNTFHLYSNGVRYNDNCDACPRTTNLVENLPGAAIAGQGQAYFSVMDPGTHVTPHCGPTNARLRCHLGLIVPDSSKIRVGDQTIHWRELGCIVFDDSFEHEVWNPDAERAVLIIDIWHPELTTAERWAIKQTSRLSGRNRRYRRRV